MTVLWLWFISLVCSCSQYLDQCGWASLTQNCCYSKLCLIWHDTYKAHIHVHIQPNFYVSRVLNLKLWRKCVGTFFFSWISRWLSPYSELMGDHRKARPQEKKISQNLKNVRSVVFVLQEIVSCYLSWHSYTCQPFCWLTNTKKYCSTTKAQQRVDSEDSLITSIKKISLCLP